MTNRISTDKPVSNKTEDRFQRYNFSKRIAETIIDSDNNDSIVIGIYGVWGEGKTSVINFIESELVLSKDTITIRFNPWRFTDEATLLVSFFNTLASVIQQSFNTPITTDIARKGLFKMIKKSWNNRKKPLQTDGEVIGEIIQKYGKIVSIFGAGEAAEVIGNSLAHTDIETLKIRFENLLIKSNKKVVVFIDDIDRLDKQEIHSIFRLVKLTADFSNTIYILSFDQEMVASAIGERFGKGNQDAGYNFLEKIIQVPLKLPIAQPSELKKYCFELVDKSIKDNNLSLNEKEIQRFVSEFSENVLIRLKTPRLAVRYGNTLSFSIPLLKGEVNHVDLMLIEAIKIFYPLHYEFIKKYPNYFISSYSRNFSLSNGSDIELKKKELEEHFVRLGHDLTKRENSSIKSLLIELFPRLNEAFHNTYLHNVENKWFKEKRIVSTEYFSRYFTYTVLKGEISDVSFDTFLERLLLNDNSIIFDELKSLISQSSIDNFLHKIRSLEDDLDWEVAKKLIFILSSFGINVSERGSYFIFGSDSPKSQAAIFIHQILKKHNVRDDNFEVAKELMKNAQPFDFAYEINNWLRIGETEEDKLFLSDQYIELASNLRERALLESNETPLFEKFPNCIGYLFSTWKEYETDSFDNYIFGILAEQPSKVLDLLIAFTPIVSSSNHPEPYRSNFSKESYLNFISLFDKEIIHRLIREQYKEEILKEKVQFFEFKNEQTNINILRQFEHWYDKELEESKQ